MDNNVPRRTKRQYNRSAQRNLKNEKRDDNKTKKSSNTGTTHEPANNKARNRGRNRRRDRNRRKDDFTGIKLVLRMLPPDLTKEQFLEVLISHVGKLSYYNINNWYYVQGHYSSKLYTEPLYSRCYLIFETVNQLKEFSEKAEQIKFTDKRNNSSSPTIKISPYNKGMILDNKKLNTNSKSLEGSIKDDALFKIFLTSWKLLEEKGSEYSFENVSILKNMEKELSKKKQIETEIDKKTESALRELTGQKEQKGGEKSSKDKKKNRRKKKKVLETGTKNVVQAKPKKEGSTPRKSKKKKAKSTSDNSANASLPNNNVVILEAAGRRELQRRKKLKEAKAALNVDSVIKSKQAMQQTQRQQGEFKAAKLKILKKTD